MSLVPSFEPDIWNTWLFMIVFLPFHTGTIWFYIGLGVFIMGLIILVSATMMVFRTPADKPFTGGIYRFSLHPYISP